MFVKVRQVNAIVIVLLYILFMFSDSVCASILYRVSGPFPMARAEII